MLVRINVEALLLVVLVMVRTFLYGLTIDFYRVICLICSLSRYYQLLVYLRILRYQISFEMVSRFSHLVARNFSIFGTLSLHIHELGCLTLLFGRVTFLVSFELTLDGMCYKPEEMSTLCIIYFGSCGMFQVTFLSFG